MGEGVDLPPGMVIVIARIRVTRAVWRVRELHCSEQASSSSRGLLCAMSIEATDSIGYGVLKMKKHSHSAIHELRHSS